MKEENTQGINTETAVKDRLSATKTASKTELLDLRAGYSQHTSPTFRRSTENNTLTSSFNTK
jgi:hypothetical protein